MVNGEWWATPSSTDGEGGGGGEKSVKIAERNFQVL